MLYSVKTGETAFNHVFGMSKWQYMTEHPDEAATFNAAIVDVGGGDGSLLATILKSNGHAHGVLADLPHVAEKAGLRISAEGLADRCRAIPSDFFDRVPTGDVCLLKFIIHDWDDERSVAILRNCGTALAPNGRVLLIEAVVEPGRASAFTKFMDLNMLVMTGGRERTEPEYRKLPQSAGLTLTRVVPTHTEMSIIEASA